MKILKNALQKTALYLVFFASLFLLPPAAEVSAFDTTKLGVHILNPSELHDAKSLVTPGLDNTTDLAEQNWSYVTVPITLDNIQPENKDEWQQFFTTAKDLKVIPIVRLATRFSSEKSAWVIPNKKNIVDQLTFLSSLEWPTGEKHIIVFNEVNHATEWGGKIDPIEYAETLKFASDWAHTEEKNYVVLPAAMDLAAPNGSKTMEAFNYLTQMHSADPEIFSYVDVWNSHSYPNPGFSSSPTRVGKNSLRGFQYELSFLKAKTGNDYKVMITETGWKETSGIANWLSSYYQYAMQHIWSDDRVIAVTPFLLKGAPGPFAGFSFYDGENKPTNQFYAFQSAITKLTSTHLSEEISSL